MQWIFGLKVFQISDLSFVASEFEILFLQSTKLPAKEENLLLFLDLKK